MIHRPPSNGGGTPCTPVSVPDKMKGWLDRDGDYVWPNLVAQTNVNCICREKQRELDWDSIGLADCPSSMLLGRRSKCKKWSRFVGRYSSRKCMSSSSLKFGFRQKVKLFMLSTTPREQPDWSP